MSAINSIKENTKDVALVKKMRDYSNDPAFKKKAEDAKEFLKKHGLPKSFNRVKSKK